MTRSLVWYVRAVTIGFVVAAAAGALWGQTPAIPADPVRLLPLIAIAIISEALIVAEDDHEGGGHVLSFSATAHVATAILFGPVPAAAVAVVAVVVVDGARMVQPRWIAMNASMFGSAILASGYLYQFLGGTTGTVTSTSAVALVALVVARPLVNSSIYAGGMLTAAGGQWFRLFGSNVRDNLAVSIGEASLGVVLASAYSGQRWVVLPFLVPLLAGLYTASSTLERLKRETAAALGSFARVIDQRDPNTASHTERVAEYVERFVTAIGLPEREAQRLVAAARFHDLGKVAVDVSTLSSNRRLSEAEMRAIRSHPRLSARLLAPFHFAEEMATFVELHHERFDGVGYYGVDAAEIPIEAHVLIAADSFDAMTSPRAYRPALSPTEAAAELRDKAGSQFHPIIAVAFAAMIEGCDPAEALGSQQLAELRACFSRMRLLPRIDLSSLLQPGVLAATSTAIALTAPVVAHGAPVLAAVGLAAVADTYTVVTLVRQHRSQRMMFESLNQTGSAAVALRHAGIDCRVLTLVWDPNRDVYVARDVADREGALFEAEEVTSRALRVFADVDRVLSNGSHLWLSIDEEWDVRTAVLTSRPLTRWQRMLAGLAANRTASVTDRIPRQIEEADTDRYAAAPPPQRSVLVIQLEGFDEIRMTAGHLVARRVMAGAESAIAGVLRGEDAVIRLAEDRFAVIMTDQSAAPHIRGRIEECVQTVEVPARAHRLRARFEQTAESTDGLQAA